jgi:hypothetical protein
VLGINLEAQTNNQVFYLDVNNTVNKLTNTPTNGWVNQNLGQGATGASRLSSFTDNVGSHVFYQDISNQLNHLLGTGSSSGVAWTNQILSQLAGAAPEGGSPLTSFVDKVGEHVFYLDINHQVNQVLGVVGSSGVTWTNQLIPGASLATGATGLTSFSDSAGEHVFYVDSADRVNHLLGTVGSTGSVTWTNQNLTQLANGPATSGVTALTSFTDSTGSHVFYEDSGNQLDHLSSTAGVTWTNQLLGQAPEGGSPLTSFTDNTGEHVFYLDINQRVNHLSSTAGVTWTNQNLSILGNGPSAAGAAGLTSFADGAGEHLVYVGSSLAVNRLLSPNGVTWTNQNLTQLANGAGTSGSSPLGSTPAPLVSRFVPVTPCRVADTRNANGPFGGPSLIGGSSRAFAIPASACGIPANAQAYALNLTVGPKGPLGFLTAFPCGQTLPLSSNLNSIDGRVKAVAAIVPAGTNGAVCAFVTDNTDFVLDISGYFVPATTTSALAFFPLTPCRVADTRLPTGPLGGPSLVANTPRTFPILSSACSIPATAQAYSLNLTVGPLAGTLGFLTAWPAGQSQPGVSNLNAPTGVATANAAIVPAGASGGVSFFATNNTDLVIDIDGYFAPPGPGGLSLFSLTPCRVLDTRNPPGTPIPANGTIVINVTGSGCGAPASAKAYVLNATVAPITTPPGLGFLTLWPDGAVQPLVSTLNAVDGAVTSNLAIVPTTNGSIDAFALNPTHLVLDIFGYFAP